MQRIPKHMYQEEITATSFDLVGQGILEVYVKFVSFFETPSDRLEWVTHEGDNFLIT